VGVAVLGADVKLSSTDFVVLALLWFCARPRRAQAPDENWTPPEGYEPLPVIPLPPNPLAK
jgi:hypothetical protein